MMNKDLAMKSLRRSTDKNNEGLKSASDHVRSSPSFRSSPRMVTPLSIFKRRPKAFKSKVADSSDIDGDQRSVVSSLQADDESTRSSIRSFRLGIRRGNYSPSKSEAPPLMPTKAEAVLTPPPITKRLAGVASDTQGVDRNPAFRPRLEEDSFLTSTLPTPPRDNTKPRKSRLQSPARRKAATDVQRVITPTPPRTRPASPPRTKSATPAQPESASPPRSGRRYSAPTSLTNSKKAKKKPNYDSDNAQPGSGIRLSKPVKIFLLLLQPKSKIFELIRIACHPQGTSVSGVLSMIPLSATEHALGLQEYIGLCRPTDGGDVSDSDGYVQITRGEILVAIPKGYTGPTIAPIGMRILSNPKIVKLLKRSEQSSRRNRRSYRESLNKVETVPENEELNGDESTTNMSTSSEMKIVLKKAAKLAAAANADVVDKLKGSTTPKKRNTSDSRSSENRFDQRASWSSARVSFDETGSLGSMRHSSNRTFSEEDASVEDSYSTWSKSLDYSFAGPSSVTGGSTMSMQSMQSSTLRRRHRRTRRLSYTKNAVVATLSMMILWYCSDPHGRGYFVDETTANPMGLVGLVQTVIMFWSIYKAQRWVRRSKIVAESRDRCPFLRESSDVFLHVHHSSNSRSLSGFP